MNFPLTLYSTLFSRLSVPKTHCFQIRYNWASLRLQRAKRKAPNRLVERKLLINGTNPYGELALKLLCSELCGKSSSELENIAAEDSWAKKSICLVRKLREKIKKEAAEATAEAPPTGV